MATSSIVNSINDGAAAKRTQYQSLLDANPYRNITYQKSPWQNFLTKLGFRTQADAWRENMNVQAREYDAAILQKEYDEQYNDPQSQLERMRAAGLNPDIDGGSSIDPGSAAPLGEDPSTPMQTTGDEGTILAVANGVMSAFSTAVGIMQSVQGVHSTHLKNVLTSLQTEADFSDFTRKLWPYMLPDSPDPDYMANEFDWQAVALKNAESFAGRLPKKFQRKFVDQVSQYWKSGPGQAESYDAWKKRVQERRSFYSEQNTFYSDIDDVLDKIVQPLTEMTEKIYKNRQNLEVAQTEAAEVEANYQKEYFSELDGTAAAQAENASNKRSRTEDDIIDTLNKTIEQITDGLDDARKDGGIKGGLASIALALIAGLRLYILHGSGGSFNRSPVSGPKGTTNSSSFSIGF